MIFKQKIYNFLAIVNDYQGMHITADRYRKEHENIIYASFDVLTLWIFPFIVLAMFILTGRFHSPNCECNDMKMIKGWNEGN